MSMINIMHDQNDIFARYKMPILEIRVKNGITYVINLVNVSKALKINLVYIVKYIGQSLSTRSTYNYGTNEWSINGKYDNKTLMIHMRKFIDECILCSKCGLPELDYKIYKKVLYQVCRACSCNYKCPSDGIFNYIYKTIESDTKKVTLPNVKINDKITNGESTEIITKDMINNTLNNMIDIIDEKGKIEDSFDDEW